MIDLSLLAPERTADEQPTPGEVLETVALLVRSLPEVPLTVGEQRSAKVIAADLMRRATEGAP